MKKYSKKRLTLLIIVASLVIGTAVPVAGKPENSHVYAEASGYLKANEYIFEGEEHSFPGEIPKKKDDFAKINTVTEPVIGIIGNEESRKAFDIINRYRIENGLEALLWNEELKTPAIIRAAEASLFWSHTRPDGNKYTAISPKVSGENLGQGYQNAQEIVEGWKGSPSHNRVLLLPGFKSMSIAYVRTKDNYFWSAEFSYELPTVKDSAINNKRMKLKQSVRPINPESLLKEMNRQKLMNATSTERKKLIPDLDKVSSTSVQYLTIAP